MGTVPSRARRITLLSVKRLATSGWSPGMPKSELIWAATGTTRSGCSSSTLGFDGPPFDSMSATRRGAAGRREIGVFEPYLGHDTLGAVARAFHDRWLGMGSATREFEAGIAEFLRLEGREVVATNTGTS